ncbi:MAG: hypothetical protein K6F26_05770 [Lachnospiraceae bacterium]|nr:hypothetical protein [Lachnospiraceae bacterium]
MTVKSKKYSYVLSFGFLLLFVQQAYSFVYAVLHTAKSEDISVLKALKEFFDKDIRLSTVSLLMVIAALLVMFLSMVSNNRFLFFLGALLVTAEFGIYTYRWIHDNKSIKWSWGDMRITGLIYCCIITGLVLLFMLIGAFLLLRAANATGIFTILMRSSIILGILLSITLDVLPLLTKEWSAESWSDTIDRYQFPCDGFIAYIPMAFIVLLGAKWMDLRLDEAAAVKAAKTPAQPAAEPEQPAAPEPVQPVAAPEQPVAPAPVYTAPAETPAEAPAAAPVETPAEASVEAPAEVSAEASAETTAEAPVLVPAEEPEEPLPFAKYDDPAEVTEKAAEAVAEAADDLSVTEDEVNAFLNGTVKDVTDAAAETASTAAEAVAETTETAAETVAETAENAGEAAAEKAAESLTNVEEKLF